MTEVQELQQLNSNELAAAFKGLFDRADKDQWELAKIAWVATEGSMSVKGFAALVGKATGTISRYRATYIYKQNHDPDRDLSFTDAAVLAQTSDERAAALTVVAGVNDITLKTATRAEHEQAVDAVRELITENPSLMVEAMKDDDTHDAIASQAFEAKREEIVGAATGIAKKAADKRATKATEQTQGRAHIEATKMRLAVFQHNAEGSVGSIAHDIKAQWGQMSERDHEQILASVETIQVKLNVLRGAVGLDMVSVNG